MLNPKGDELPISSLLVVDRWELVPDNKAMGSVGIQFQPIIKKEGRVEMTGEKKAEVDI